ncbi:MAG: cupin-like domain-containing protein [Bdellovibrio sp.]|nr:cupin-like domain-containing protein [Bdellovibrio sp.]
MNNSGLAALVHPHKIDKFLTENWPNEPFIIHDLGESIKEITALPFLKSLNALLNAWDKPVQVHLPDVSDESSAIDASSADARKLFANKMALLFNNVQTLSPELTKWLRILKKDLGLPTSTYARCMAYATPDGKGTRAHFDQNINFVLQLHGTKKWWLAPNVNVENPTERFTVGQPVDLELASYVETEMPSAMPGEDRTEVILKPGSMLFVPRGFWHSTEASGEALALNFTFNQPTWIDLFTIALRSRLTLSPDWRELADGVASSDSDRRQLAEQRFDILLQELIEDMPNWKAQDILRATEGEFS